MARKGDQVPGKESGREAGGIDWERVRESLPKSSRALLDLIAGAVRGEGEDPARGIEKKLRERLGALRRRFEEIRGTGR